MANKELDNVIKIGNADYNVNAVKAKYLDHKLIIKRVGFDGTTLVNPIAEFNGGDSDTTVEIIPAIGGKYKGHLRVPSADTEIKVGSNTITNTTTSDGVTTFVSDAVLNYSDIVDVVLKNVKNNAIVYTWDGTSINGSVDGSINSISIIQGHSSNASQFANENNDWYSTNKPYLPTYFYIGTDNNQVYFGTAERSDCSLLNINMATEVESAKKLTNPRTITVNLKTTGSATFDGSNNVELGVSDILQPDHGGTGQTSLSAVCVGEADHAFSLRDQENDNITVTANETREAIDNVAGILATSGSNLITVPRASFATNATNAANATRASLDSMGNPITTYYQKKITYSTDTPSGGSVGDIWIVYSKENES